MIIMSIIRSEVALLSLEVAAPQVLPLLYHVLPFKRSVSRIRLTELVCISDCFHDAGQQFSDLTTLIMISLTPDGSAG